MGRSEAYNTTKGERREGALQAGAALLLALVLLGGPPTLAEEEGWDVEEGLAAVSLPSALDDFRVAQLEAVPGGAEVDGVPEVVAEGLPAMDAATNPRYEEEPRPAASPGADQPSSLESAQNQPESFEDTSVAAPIEPLVDSSLIDPTLEVTPGEDVDGAVGPPPSPPSAVTIINAEQEEPLPPSSLDEQVEDTPAGGAPESQEQATIADESGQQSTAAVIPETVSPEPSEAGADVDRDNDLLATPERAASPSPMPSSSDVGQSDELEAEQAPAGEEEAFEEEAADSFEAAAPTTEANAKAEFERSSVGQTAEAAEGGDIDAEGKIDGGADGANETQGEAVVGPGIAEREEPADRVVDARQAAFEEAVTSAPEVVATDCTGDELVSESGRLEPPQESEEGQGEGWMPTLDLIEDPEKVQHTASGGKLETPKEECDDEGKVKEEDELQKKLRQESLMAARKKRLREQAVNQTAEEEERAREVVRRKLESLLQRDQTPRPSEPSPTEASVPEGSGVKPTRVGRVSDGAKAPARAAVGLTEKLPVPKRARETSSPAVGVASPSAGATTVKRSLARSSSFSAVGSPTHPVPAPGLTKANPTRQEPMPHSHFASEARAGPGLRIDEHVKVVERDLDEGEDDLDEDEDEDYGDDEDDALFDDGDGDGDELAAPVGSAPQQRSQSAKDQGAEAAAHAEAGSADKARKLAERKILLKMAKEASGISHSVSEDSDMKAWKRRAKLKNMESRRKQDVPTYDITNAAARRRELDRVKKEKQKSKGSLRYKKAA